MTRVKDIVIGKRIRQARQDLSFTQEEVASAIGISRDKYANIESGRTTCSLTDANEICDFLGLDIQELLKEDESSLESMILFRGRNENSYQDNERLLDLSDTIFQELMSQVQLKQNKAQKVTKYV